MGGDGARVAPSRLGALIRGADGLVRESGGSRDCLVGVGPRSAAVKLSPNADGYRMIRKAALAARPVFPPALGMAVSR